MHLQKCLTFGVHIRITPREFFCLNEDIIQVFVHRYQTKRLFQSLKIGHKARISSISFAIRPLCVCKFDLEELTTARGADVLTIAAT